MPTKFVFDTDQRFACRDCPAKCCRLPMAIPLGEDEISRLTDAPWVQERVGEEGIACIRRGVLPSREVDGALQCALLDDDDRCGLHKALGHEALPHWCQAYPFAFVRDEKDRLILQASQICPSIQQRYGEPLTVDRLEEKLEQLGKSDRMSKAMATRHGQILNQKQYLRVVRRWLDILAADAFPPESLLTLYEWTRTFEDAVPRTAEKPADGELSAAIDKADRTKVVPFSWSTGPSWQTRMLYSTVFGTLSYPARVVLPHRVDAPTFMMKTRARWARWKWVLGRGEVDLLHIPGHVALGEIDSVRRFLSTPTAQPISQMHRRIIEQRAIFRQPRHMMDVLIDLVLSTVIASRYARCVAVSEARSEVSAGDIEAGMAIAELGVLRRGAPAKSGRVMTNVRRTLIADRAAFLRLLASENNETSLATSRA